MWGISVLYVPFLFLCAALLFLCAALVFLCAALLFLWCITVLYVVFMSYSKLPKTSFFARNVLIGLVRAGFMRGC